MVPGLNARCSCLCLKSLDSSVVNREGSSVVPISSWFNLILEFDDAAGLELLLVPVLVAVLVDEV